MHCARISVRIVASLCFLVLSKPLFPAALEIGPEANLCRTINSLPAGEELVLRPGDYRGPCAIRRGGEAGAPLIIRAQDLGQRPRIVYPGTRSNALEVRAEHVTIRGLAFGPTQRNIDAIRIFSGGGITIEDCEFIEVGGIAVVANHHSIRGLTVRHNNIVRNRATGMYFGCHDGVGCTVSDLTIVGNHITFVDAPDPEIGYGIQVKLNSWAVIRENVVRDTKGPAIMVYGAADPERVSVVERNVVTGSRQSAGIVVGGGPAVVRNNVAVSNAAAGIQLQDYGRRGLLSRVTVTHNTVYQAGPVGIGIPEDAVVRDAAIVGNAIQVRPGGAAVPGSRPGVRLEGNIDCTDTACFANPSVWDFSPFSGSALLANRAGNGGKAPPDDFFGRPRGARPSAGAIEPPGGAIALDPR